MIADGHHTTHTFTVFVLDEKKGGGLYESITGVVKKTDTVTQKVVLMTTARRSWINKAIDFE